MIVDTATREDIDAIADRFSAITRAELEVAGKTAEEYRDYMQKQIIYYPAQVLKVEDKPAAILGCEYNPEDPTMLFTWFACTDAFWKLGLRGVIFGRRYMRDLVSRHPDKGIYTICVSPHPDVLRWFELIGGRWIATEGKANAFAFEQK